MQSTAVPGTSNGIKRSAANAHLNEPGALPSVNKSTSSSAAASSSSSTSSSPPPPEKRSYIVVESPFKLEAIASAEDLDVKVLRIQNKHLSERLLQRQKLESELREKIEALQNRKAADDSKLCIVDRYWTQLDENLRLMMEQFESSTEKNKENSDVSKKKSLSQEARRFLAKLNDWDKEELDEALKERLTFTTQTVGKLVSSYDRMHQRYEQQTRELIRQNPNSSQEPMDTSTSQFNFQELFEENSRLKKLITQCQENVHTIGLENKQLEDKITLHETELKELHSRYDEAEYELEKTRDKAFKLDRQLADILTKMTNLQKNVAAAAANNNGSQVPNHVDQNGQSSTNNNNSNNNLKPNEKQASITEKQLNDLEAEVEENKELAASRLQELERLNSDYQNTLKQIEKLKGELKMVPDAAIEQSTEYKNLQTKYSLIVNDNVRLKHALEETRALFESSRVQFQRQLEQIESEELSQQKKLGNELMLVEEQLSQVRKENELLRIEYEQNVAANEQTGPINKEMRSLITTLQTNNKLLKQENQRAKKRTGELQDELEKFKKQHTQLQEDLKKQQQQQQQQQLSTATVKKESSIPIKEESMNFESESKSTDDVPASTPAAAATETPVAAVVKKEEPDSSAALQSMRSTIQHKDMQIKELKEQAKRLHDDLKDKKAILEAYKSSSKLQSPTAKKNNSIVELEEAKVEIRRLREANERLKAANKLSSNSAHNLSSTMSPSNHHHHASTSHHSNLHDDSSSVPSHSSSSSEYKRIKNLEEQVRELHKSLNNKKQEEAALLNDMEITGQAFEDMQEQNVRLMQQLREKDDANFKLVSERIKLENVQRILKEEKEILAQQVTTLQEQQEAQMVVSKKLEEQLGVMGQNQAIFEKEIQTLRQSCDNYMRHAMDSVHHIQDLKMNLHKYSCQLKEAQEQIEEKSETLASQSFNNKRSQEEIRLLQLKLERHKRYEMASSTDEVLQEELKEYREQLRCPSCKVKQKDAVLTKCFHVFCIDCLQKRYETRQRKCPKCNAGFGANDFRKIYLS